MVYMWPHVNAYMILGEGMTQYEWQLLLLLFLIIVWHFAPKDFLSTFQANKLNDVIGLYFHLLEDSKAQFFQGQIK